MKNCNCGLSRKPNYPKGHFDLMLCYTCQKEIDDLKESLGINEGNE